MNRTIDDIGQVEISALEERRERVFLALAGTFICAMTMLNIIGITRFVQLGPMSLAIGVLPYPITFLCTDLICELYGRRRANYLVTVGLALNFFILAVMWLAQAMPAVPAETMPPWQQLQLTNQVILPDGEVVGGTVDLFYLVYSCTAGAVFASMMAYIAAQYCDVQLFHFWKRVTRGKHLWVRNNFSTLLSQGVDSFMVVSVTFGAAWLADTISTPQLLVLMASNYAFKFCTSVADTLPFYLLTARFKRYLQLD
jgi:uncharacterized PurR-regulated membrane protein YhhQ (DUF165 family)